MSGYTTLDYTCAGCGAQAVTEPSPLGSYYSRVMVPHELGCPVAARVTEARSRALMKEGRS